jgi:TQO small subunit DoxD
LRKFLASDSVSIENASRVGLVISRLTIGILWFAQLFWKLPPGFGCPANFAVTTDMHVRTTGLCDWVGIMTLYSRWPLQASLVKSLVVPNLAWMGWIIFLMEAFVALSLILGVFTRLGGLAAFLQAVNLYLGVSAAPGEWPWTYIMLAVLGLIFMAIPAGRVLGLDAWLRRSLRAAAQRGNRLARILLALT